MAEALTSAGRDTDTPKRGVVVYKINQFPLFSLQVHIYLGGSSYKCETKALMLDNWNCMYLLEM